ncbi:MAG: UDP-N-acetylmuramoyl-L-alanyl-D-glutamate--2,6-diaminopimelate ligase [Proteobacteria bacterium]|nr:UDP-N-acetylmuramoyl-L-alanyl-D-glutamate--2,6-diaminopimelate ligase [Pseudomonadota bacterium]
MILGELLGEEARFDPRFATLPIAAISADSRTLKPGSLFVAMAGTRDDGLAHVAGALAAGAVAVMAERAPSPPLPPTIAFVQAANVRLALARAAARFHPRQPATVVAVTGTAGKTSVAYFTRQIWEALGLRAAYVGTLGVVAPGREVHGNLTTPDPVALHRMLDALAGAGVTHVALEASSHGLAQYRLDGVRFTAAAFTNLGRDHLDYHASMQAYLAAKLRLFAEVLDARATVVLPRGEPGRALPGVAEVLAIARARGLKTLEILASAASPLPPGGDLRAAIGMAGLAQALRFEPPIAGMRDVALPLTGIFQASNALVAAGLAIAAGGEPSAVVAALSGLKNVPGRLDLAGAKHGAGIFVDYAHKPEALDAAISALRPFVLDGGRLIVVFGAGGDRDAGKRVLMGRVAAERAELVVVTDDNPRSEVPGAIRAAILGGCPGAIEIGDRAAAIRWAIGELKHGDILLIAGKGHETGQIIGDRVLPFSDHDVVAAALAEGAP